MEPLAPATDQPWSRLDKRMLLVHPVTEVVKFIPVLIGSVILGTSSGNHVWSVIPLALIVGFALTRWFTTTYRVGPTHVELRTGLIQRKKLSVPRSRIRSVDIEADVLHRLLGLAVLAIGTGQQADSGEQFKLDALDARLVPELRAALLAHTSGTPQSVAGQTVSEADATGTVAAESQQRPPSREIAHWNPSWVRYAPLSLTGFAIVAPIVGLAFQYGVGQVLFRSDAVQWVENGGAVLIAVSAIALVLVIVLVVSLAACARYLTTYFGLRVLDDGRTLHLRHGLFTTRQITLDLARFRGATVNEPLLLRLAGAAELEAIMTGENPRQKILPQAPRTAIEHTLSHLLAPNEFQDKVDAFLDKAGPHVAGPTPGSAPLRTHGPVARRRRHTRTLVPIAVAALVMLAFSAAGADFSPWWWAVPALLVPAAIALAEDRYRGLGHTVLPETATSPTWLITRSGSLDRDRDCLEAPGVIGWTVRQTFFQRRAGVATLIAATAAGKKRYVVLDIALDQAWSLIDATTPGLLGTAQAAERG
ncbi:PH domain-containing protein [Nocardia brasiliensis]|uniref:PH domain-containing protein n=1 Tax=Nocardia brasiliensis TaxID=37326 RepID=UPI00366CD09A